jgi:selenocysteine-specific elongation factor
MVGTAGHVDHGKTMLVKALTGCDTDTLPEEKARGMSINLGFAPCKLPGKRVVGIVDVPGHEDFIKNMVAGATSIDVLVLVVAADDGIMPQTREHLKITGLLHIPVVMAAITKIDLVDAHRQIEVKNSVAEFLREHGYDDAPIVMVSTVSGVGIDEVRQTIQHLVAQVKSDEPGLAFRMNIERSFTVKGYGTVLTGIPMSGRCAVGDELEILPGRLPTVVRALQKFKNESPETQAHICSAINIRNIESNTILRGMTLATPGVYRETFSAIVSIKNVHESISIKRQAQFRIHYGTSAAIVDGILVDRSALVPGESGFMRIRSAEPMIIAAGDRFIMRSLSPISTAGGGVVVSIRTQTRTKKYGVTTETLAKARGAAESGDPFRSEILAGDAAIINLTDLPYLFRCRKQRVDEFVAAQERAGILIPIGPVDWIIQSRIAEVEDVIVRNLTRYHSEKKYSSGMPVADVCRSLGLDRSCGPGLSKVVSRSSRIAVQVKYFSLHDFSPALSDHQVSIKEKIVDKVIHSTTAAPALGDLQQELEVSDSDMRLMVRLLQEEGVLTCIDRHLVHNEFIARCLDSMVRLSGKQSSIELQSFREETGLSRNTAVPILEHFDALGITRREGRGRILVQKSVKE